MHSHCKFSTLAVELGKLEKSRQAQLDKRYKED